MNRITNNQIPFEPLILESNSNPTNNWYTKGVLRAMHSISKIPSHLINAWKGSTTFQKVLGTTTAIYCTAATVYTVLYRSFFLLLTNYLLRKMNVRKLFTIQMHMNQARAERLVYIFVMI